MFLSFKRGKKNKQKKKRRETKWRQNICTFASLCLTFCLSVCLSVRALCVPSGVGSLARWEDHLRPRRGKDSLPGWVTTRTKLWARRLHSSAEIWLRALNRELPHPITSWQSNRNDDVRVCVYACARACVCYCFLFWTCVKPEAETFCSTQKKKRLFSFSVVLLFFSCYCNICVGKKSH